MQPERRETSPGRENGVRVYLLTVQRMRYISIGIGIGITRIGSCSYFRLAALRRYERRCKP
jgi:hypothetical protein